MPFGDVLRLQDHHGRVQRLVTVTSAADIFFGCTSGSDSSITLDHGPARACPSDGGLLGQDLVGPHYPWSVQVEVTSASGTWSLVVGSKSISQRQ